MSERIPQPDNTPNLLPKIIQMLSDIKDLLEEEDFTRSPEYMSPQSTYQSLEMLESLPSMTQAVQLVNKLQKIDPENVVLKRISPYTQLPFSSWDELGNKLIFDINTGKDISWLDTILNMNP